MAEIDPKEQVVVRFAPSPTGVLHVGSARTALFNYLFARKNSGKMILRIEDTDKDRSKPEYEKDIKTGLSWLGIDFDEEYRQSDRGEVYKKYIEKMINDGTAFEAEENKDGTGKIIRFKNPNTKITFEDKIRGEVTFDTTELGDFVIAKDLNSPLYHLGVVVDDHEMGVTHVIRGEDGISNTPRQILIQDAIGAIRPSYAHIPLILASDKSKLSKRHGAVSVLDFRNKGYLPEALVNFLALIGWNPGDEREIFSMEELIKEFTLEKIQKGGAVFNTEKLDWFNKEYIRNFESQKVKKSIDEWMPEKIKQLEGYNNEMLIKITPIILERINKWSDIGVMAEEGEYDYYFEQPQYLVDELFPNNFSRPNYDKEDKLFWTQEKRKEIIKKHIQKVVEIMQNISQEDFTAEKIKEAICDYATEEGRGNVLWPMRYALSGRDKSPDPFLLAELLGKDESIKRIAFAIKKLA